MSSFTGEALDSLPARTSVASNVVTSVAPTNNGSAKGDAKSSPNSKELKTDYLKKNSGFCNSHFVSKLIIAVVATFFFFLVSMPSNFHSSLLMSLTNELEFSDLSSCPSVD
jgi:hypothetical protein